MVAVIKTFSIDDSDLPIHEDLVKILNREGHKRGFSKWLLSQMKEYIKVHKSGNPIYPITNYFDPAFQATPAFYSNYTTWKNWLTKIHDQNEKTHKEFDQQLQMLIKLTNDTWKIYTF
jgi:hypothetical protein